jgi:hypothetical protein
MASVLTDQVLRAKLMAPVVGLTTSAQVVQFATVPPFGQSGNASVSIPGTNRLSNLFRVRAQGKSTLVGTTTVTLTLLLDGVSLGTLVSASATGSDSFSLSADLSFESATLPIRGVMSGWYGVTLKANTATSATTVDLTAEGHLLTLSVTAGAADAGSVTVSEFSLEVL